MDEARRARLTDWLRAASGEVPAEVSVGFDGMELVL